MRERRRWKIIVHRGTHTFNKKQCQGHAEREQSDPEWSGITLEWKGVDNKSGGTTLASACVLCLCHMTENTHLII